MTCVEIPATGGIEARAACGIELCGPEFVIECVGEEMVQCDGALSTLLPRPPGQSCGTRFGSTTFVPSEVPCESSGCLGHRAVVCDTVAGFVVSDIDCASLGRVCSESLGSAICAAPEDANCTGTLPSCDGDVVRFCGPDQHLRDYDCRAHGFAGCEERFSPVFGTLVGCAPVGPRF